MVIEALDESLIAHLRSSSSVDSVTQCVNELVLNSLDAKATAVAIRVNLTSFRIQIVDNGKGISGSNLKSVGLPYMTNKCHDLQDLKKRLKFYGFKGEALANIARVSQRVIITTREENSEETFEKIIEKDEHKVEAAKKRPSCGTTVTVEGFLNNLPVRQQCVKNNELDNIKRNIESLIIIHPRVSFTLRNDLVAKLILSSVKCPDIASAFRTIHPEVDEKSFSLLKISKNKTAVEGLIHKEFCENKRLQYVYVNKRPINCPKVQNLINSLFKKISKTEKKKNPIFVVHIRCPYSDVDVTLEPAKTVVYFKKFDIIRRCVEKMVITHLGAENVPIVKKRKNAPSEFGVSQIAGVVKGFGIKRKSEEVEEPISVKSPKMADIIDDTPFLEEPKVPSKKTKMALPIEIKKNKKETCDADNTLFTNFPENEKKGKGVIMDKFILSLKDFPAENQNLEKKSEENEEFPIKVSLGVQTRQENMVSVGVQVGFSAPESIIDTDITLFPRKSLRKFVSDYDYDFSKIDAFPEMNFHKPEPALPFVNFDQTRKLFDFRKNDNFFDQRSVYNFNENMTINEYFPKTKIFENVSRSVQQSPYFLKKTTKKPLIPRPKSRDMICECQNESKDILMDTTKVPIVTKNLKQVEFSFIKKESIKKPLNETCTSKYFTPRSSKTCSRIFSQQKNPSEDPFNFSGPPQNEESCLIISLGAKNEKEEILNKNKLSEDVLDPTLTQFRTYEENNFDRRIFELKKDTTFEMTERFDFVPKGLSPILKDYGKVDDMSPESKEQLQNALIQSYEDELLLIKWQNYIENRDPKKFFEEIYLEKSKLIESAVPNISKTSLAKYGMKGFENISFTKTLFKNLEIIGQVDRKFIAAFEKTQKLLLLFDQHAVHERVRLEELSEGYKCVSTKLDQNITIFIPQNDLKLLKGQKPNIRSLGLVMNFFTNGITIFEVPLCVYNKSKKGVDIITITESLIKEIIETLKINNGIIVSTPKVIQNIVNSEACRGAIKFGDLLTKNECVMHVKRLIDCSLPFQCAHGRPTLTPLMYLNKSFDYFSEKPQLSNLKYR